MIHTVYKLALLSVVGDGSAISIWPRARHQRGDDLVIAIVGVGGNVHDIRVYAHGPSPPCEAQTGEQQCPDGVRRASLSGRGDDDDERIYGLKKVSRANTTASGRHTAIEGKMLDMTAPGAYGTVRIDQDEKHPTLG